MPIMDSPDDFGPPPGVTPEPIKTGLLNSSPLPDASTTEVVEVIKPDQANIKIELEFKQKMEERKQRLEEMRFKLEERKEVHKLMMEDRREQQKEDALAREQEKEDQEQAKKDEKQSEHWMKSYWRPAMGWLYMGINAFDFIIAPLLTMMMPAVLKNLGATTVTYTQWQSLTLQNGGLIHLAFGAILGITAWSRGQEKVASIKTQAQ
jgi:hypothetical protein